MTEQPTSPPETSSSPASPPPLEVLRLIEAIDEELDLVERSMLKITSQLKNYDQVSGASPFSLRRLCCWIRSEDRTQRESVRKIMFYRHRLLELRKILQINTPLSSVVEAKLSSTESELKSQQTGMSAALKFPKLRCRRLRQSRRMRERYQLCALGLLWRTYVFLGGAVLLSSAVLGWTDLFSGMLVSGFLFLLASLSQHRFFSRSCLENSGFPH